MPSQLPFVFWLVAFVLGSLGIAASMILKTRNPSIARVGFLIVLFDFFVVTLAFGGLFDEELTWRIPPSDLSYHVTSSPLHRLVLSRNPKPELLDKSQLANYSDSLMEMDADIGRVTDEVRAYVPNTNVSVTADNSAWPDTYPDAGTIPFRGDKGSAYEGGWRVPGIMWWPENVPAGSQENLTIGSVYNLATGPYEQSDMMFNGAPPARALTTLPGLPIGPVQHEFDQSIMNYPGIQQFPNGTNLIPNVENPYDPALQFKNATNTKLWPAAN